MKLTQTSLMFNDNRLAKEQISARESYIPEYLKLF